MSRRRSLSEEERALWRGVARSIKPLQPSRPSVEPPAGEDAGSSADEAPPAPRRARRHVMTHYQQKKRLRSRRSGDGSRGASPAAVNRSTTASICTASPRGKRMRHCCAFCAAPKWTAPKSCSSSPAREIREANATRRPSAACSSAWCRSGWRYRNSAPLSSVSRTRMSDTAGRAPFTSASAARASSGINLTGWNSTVRARHGQIRLRQRRP
jgi:hypothetical protein